MHKTTEGFNLQTDVYERSRPSYPQQVIDFIQSEFKLAPGTRCLDLAAGTGKFTRLLLPFQFDLIAVEPIDGMREKFQNMLPNVKIIKGTADNIPLESNTFDVVFTAQAFHWFSNEKALKEIHRILKPNGIFGLIWNLEDGNKYWVSKLRELYEQFEEEAPQYRHGTWKNVFLESKLASELFNLPLKEVHFNFNLSCNPERIWERVLSKSYIATMKTQQQQELKIKVIKCLFDNVKEFQLDGINSENLFQQKELVIDYPYTTHFFWCRKK